MSFATVTHVKFTLKRFIDAVSSSNAHPRVLQQSRVLEAVAHEPWSRPTLLKIFDAEVVDIERRFIVRLSQLEMTNVFDQLRLLRYSSARLLSTRERPSDRDASGKASGSAEV